MGIFICPVCGENLEISGKSYVCGNHHCFDIARSGYVNLLLSKQTGGGVHGDNKLMVKARRDFLEKGYYEPLCEAVAETVKKYTQGSSVILDAGCGEGYYTAAVKAKIDQSNIAAEIYGIDISKTAVEFAAKRKTDIIFAAASVFHIPATAKSCDILLTMFAPYCGEEYSRVLQDDGIMVMAIPSEDHLWELKKAIYNQPYKNKVKDYQLEGFDFLDSQRVRYIMNIDNQQDIQSLFSMTPYYYKSGREEQERLSKLENISVEADFEILTYRRKGQKI